MAAAQRTTWVGKHDFQPTLRSRAIQPPAALCVLIPPSGANWICGNRELGIPNRNCFAKGLRTTLLRRALDVSEHHVLSALTISRHRTSYALNASRHRTASALDASQHSTPRALYVSRHLAASRLEMNAHTLWVCRQLRSAHQCVECPVTSLRRAASRELPSTVCIMLQNLRTGMRVSR
jgi:hypothetical protein